MKPRLAYLPGVVLAFCVLVTATPASDAVPTYEPELLGAATIAVSGDKADRALIESLQAAFVRHQPEIRFKNSLYGPESTLAPVYTGTADLAFMAREIREPMERMAFEWAKLAKPFAISYANAGFDRNRPGTQLAVFVHADNPVGSLSLGELDAIFGAEHKRGHGNIGSWGDLDVGGAWRTRPIHVFGPEVESIPALFFRRTVMLDSRKWNPGLREYTDVSEALRALSDDVSGIAFAPLAHQRPGVKTLAIAADEDRPAIALTRETVISNDYPLSRSVAIIMHLPDDGGLSPQVQEFLRFVLSADGQRIVEKSSSYLPLSGASVLRERQRLQR